MLRPHFGGCHGEGVGREEIGGIEWIAVFNPRVAGDAWCRGA